MLKEKCRHFIKTEIDISAWILCLLLGIFRERFELSGGRLEMEVGGSYSSFKKHDMCWKIELFVLSKKKRLTGDTECIK